jgi:hypothetical protein
MTVKLDDRGWTAAPNPRALRHLAPGRHPASPRGKPCHWICALAWVDEHPADEPEGRAV